VIGKVQRGAEVGGLVAYLFGPGKHNEHTDQHVVAHWTGLPGEAVTAGPDGAPDLGPLVADLKADLRAAGLLGAQDSVWHCSVAIPATDPALTDSQWREVAETIAEAVGLEDTRDGAVRWVAVRHGLSAAGNDHIHIVATLAGRTENGDVVDRTFLNRDYAKVRAVCNTFEKAWGLTATGAGTGAAHQRPSRAESEIATRRGLGAEQRVRLERAVRSAAVASVGPAEFTARLAAEGVVVTFSRESEQRPGSWLGVTFHTDDYTTADGAPVVFSGRTLARDLSAPALQARWDARALAVPAGAAGDAMRGLVDALAAASQGPAPTDVAALRGQIAAGADALWAAAEAVEADRGGVWHAAAGEAARAAREPGAVDHSEAGLLLGVLAELSGLPPAQSKEESQLRRAWATWQRLMRIWARAEQGENARVAATTAAKVAAMTAGAGRHTQPTAATARPAASGQRDQVRGEDGPEAITRSGA
jgi:hypothetical protein